jgi:hypothetical protein
VASYLVWKIVACGQFGFTGISLWQQGRAAFWHSSVSSASGNA